MTRHHKTSIPRSHVTPLAALGPSLVSARLGRDPAVVLASTTDMATHHTTTNEPPSGETTEHEISGSSEADVSSTSGSTGASSETTGAPAVCGDGVVEGDEECDDPGDTRCFKCIRDRIVFITSEEVWGNFSGMSLIPGTHCDDWQSDSLESLVYFGSNVATDGSWTRYVGDASNPIPCGLAHTLYCFESP